MQKVGEKQVIEKDKRPLYRGTFSKVFIGRFDDREVIVKRLDWEVDEEDGSGHKSLPFELEVLRAFDHKNVIKYYFKDIDEEYIYIVLEKCEHTLREFINAGKFEVQHLSILWQSTNGLAYLHSKDLIHRDLKPSNILLKQEDGWVIKITDFGISKKLAPDRTKLTQTKIRGTAGYSSPEALRHDKISKRSDIFSLGIVFYYVLSDGEHPYGNDNLKVEGRICDGEEPCLDQMSQEYIHDARTLILSMIAHKCEDRPDINEVQAHHLFWKAETKLTFIQDVSDYSLPDESFKKMSPLLEENSCEVIGDSWRETLYSVSTVVKDTFEGMRMRNKKQKDGVFDLLRNIRNLKSHYYEKSEEFRKEVGHMPDGVIHFFTSLFPKLLSHTYDIMKSQRKEQDFEKYYTINESDLKRSPPRHFSRTIDKDRNHIENDTSATEGANEKNLKTVLLEKKSDSTTNNKQDVADVNPEPPQVELVLRKYQMELAEQAINGQNSLIVAPTGSGKTAVLAEITKQHTSKVQKGFSRVIFIVPKTALAHQQHLFLSRYLRCSVSYITGEVAPLAPPGQKILDSEVTVLTPQILINELKRKVGESYITFRDISMLLFDECHNATKNHPYKEIMDMLLDFLDANPDQEPIQIVGVTASPGVGKAKDRVKVKENLLKLLANLNIMSAPSIVETNLDELEKHQNDIKETYKKVQTETEFGQSVMVVMDAIEKEVKDLNKKNDAPQLNKTPKDKTKQSYENWTNDLIQHGKLSMRDQDSARILITFAEHLKMYNCLLQLKDLVPNAMDHTNKMVTFQQEGFENKLLLEKNEALQKQAKCIKVPMLDCLSGILQDEFSINQDARCIIFVKRKLTAKSLEECFAQHSKLAFLNAKYLIGTHDSDSAEVMTKVEQENILTSFRDGEAKVIIATSVAEEGLDIPACNLVIMYNYVTGEVGRIQRAGRGRASDSRAILLTCIDSNHLKMEEDNKICAKASDQAIVDVKKLSPAELQEQVKNIQVKKKAERKRKKDMALKPNMMNPPSKWEVLCGKCKTFITTGDKLRHIEDMHVVVKDPGFESRVVRKLNEQKKGPNVRGTADFLCNNPKCGIKIALEMVYGMTSYPTLSIKKILLRREGGQLCDPKKRSRLPFIVDRSINESEEEEEYEDSVRNNEKPLDELSLNDNDTVEMLDVIEHSRI